MQKRNNPLRSKCISSMQMIAPCQAILQSYVPTLKSMYPFLDIKTFDLANPTYYEALAKLEEKFNRRGNDSRSSLSEIKCSPGSGK